MRKWFKKIGIDIFDKWLISLDHVTYYINQILDMFKVLWPTQMHIAVFIISELYHIHYLSFRDKHQV